MRISAFQELSALTAYGCFVGPATVIIRGINSLTHRDHAMKIIVIGTSGAVGSAAVSVDITDCASIEAMYKKLDKVGRKS